MQNEEEEEAECALNLFLSDYLRDDRPPFAI